MTNYDIIVSHKVLNFFTPPPFIRPAIETRLEGRFLISNLIKLESVLKGMGDSTGFLNISDLFNLLVSMTASSEGANIFPERWHGLS